MTGRCKVAARACRVRGVFKAGARPGRCAVPAGAAATGDTVKLAWADQGYVAENGIELQVVKLPEAKQGFVLRSRRWLVEHSFG